MIYPQKLPEGKYQSKDKIKYFLSFKYSRLENLRKRVSSHINFDIFLSRLVIDFEQNWS